MGSATGRNLVVCCDGTGNVWKPSASRTNVVKLLESLAVAPDRQLLYYDPGVGTPDGHLNESGALSYKAILRRVAGLAWGEGVWTNVGDGYRFLMNHHQPDDRIFLFGFSRGAFTARAIAGLVNLLGLMRPGLENLLPTALAIYRMRADTPERAAARKRAADQFRAVFARRVEDLRIHFIGVWDTVESVGVAQLALGTRITSDPSVKPAYTHVRHALALDELRWPYQPRLYTDAPQRFERDGRSFKQVWFAGAHCDVGGGYAHDGLSNHTLHWMAREANAAGLVIDFHKLEALKVDAGARLHDETVRIPLWALVGDFKRTYPDGIVVHDSVIKRRDLSHGSYAPLLPADVPVESTRETVFDPAGNVKKSPVPEMQPAALPTRQRVRPWHVLLLLATAVMVFGRLSTDALGRALALQQATQGWTLHLGARLVEWESTMQTSIGTLLAWDFAMIACYAVLIAFVMRAVQALEGRHGYPSRGIGIALCYTGGWLPVADIVENAMTLVSVSYARNINAKIDCSIPCALGEGVTSVVTSVASVCKGVLLVALVLVVGYALVKGIAQFVFRPAADRPQGDVRAG